MNGNMRRIRVLFLGDDGVGKSSLISTLLSENFPRSVQKTMPPLVIPQDFCLPTMNAETYLLDTSSAPEDEAFTNDEIERADIAIIVYDVNNPESVKRVTSYWLHRVTKLNEKIPIILVGNKIDLRMNTETSQTLETFLSPICKEFKQVEMGLECSAKSYLNIIEVVYSAQIAVLFPVSPLFDSSTKTLTQEFSKALKRVFRICDRDCDGLLSDIELKDFQQEIFQREMNNDHVYRVKQVIHSYQEAKARGRSLGEEQRPLPANEQNGLTFEEFQCLQEIMIVKRKPQTCWGILRHFGYGDNLRIKEEFFENNYREIDDWESVELSNMAMAYLLRLFKQFAVDTPRGKLLSEQSLSEIFAPSIKGKPWTVKRSTEFIPADARLVDNFRHGDYYLEFPMWVGLWQMSFFKDYRAAYKLLVYIGFMGSLKDAVEIRRSKLRELAGTVYRNVFQCFVVGALRTGKSCLLDSFIGHPFQENTIITNSQHSVVNLVENKRKNEKKYLILTEIPEHQTDYFLKQERNFKQGDVVCLVYHDEKTFLFVEEVAKRLPPYLPRILVRGKSDDAALDLELNKTIEEHAQIIGTRLYCSISSKMRKITNLIERIILTASYPSQGLNQKIIKTYRQDNYKLIIGTLIGVGVSLGAILLYRFTGIKNMFRKGIRS